MRSADKWCKWYNTLYKSPCFFWFGKVKVYVVKCDNGDDDGYNDDEGAAHSHWPDLIASICRRHAGSVSRSHQHHLKIISRTISYRGQDHIEDKIILRNETNLKRTQILWSCMSITVKAIKPVNALVSFWIF